MTRSRLVAAVALAVVVLAGCGIDAAQVATGPTTTTATSTPPATQPVGTTTTEAEPGFTLPSIPPGETGTTQAPRDTATTASTTPTGRPTRTPNGLTEAQFAGILHDQAALSVSVADCTAKHTFAEIAPKDIDTIFSADDESQLDPALALQFTSIISLCIQGG